MYEREIELIEARLTGAGLGVESGEAWQILKTAVLAQQTTNTGSPKFSLDEWVPAAFVILYCENFGRVPETLGAIRARPYRKAVC